MPWRYGWIKRHRRQTLARRSARLSAYQYLSAFICTQHTHRARTRTHIYIYTIHMYSRPHRGVGIGVGVIIAALAVALRAQIAIAAPTTTLPASIACAFPRVYECTTTPCMIAVQSLHTHGSFTAFARVVTNETLNATMTLTFALEKRARRRDLRRASLAARRPRVRRAPTTAVAPRRCHGHHHRWRRARSS